MSNPAILLLDADALIQIFLTGVHSLLTELEAAYGVQPMIVPEVEIEVVSQRQALNKALGNGTITLIDSRNFASIIGSDATLQAAAVGKSYIDIQAIGAAYNRMVGGGEAYTHAMAVSLGQPSVSNDWNAVSTLDRHRAPLPTPVLRMFDLVVLGYQIGALSTADCDNVRQTLVKTGREFIPRCWMHSSFEDGLRNFTPRLIDSAAARVGKTARAGVITHETPLLISKHSGT